MPLIRSDEGAHFAKKQKSQALFAIQSFVMYINALMQSKGVDLNIAQKAKNRALEIASEINKEKGSLDKSINYLNEIIEKTNHSLPTYPYFHAHYPAFDHHNVRTLVRHQILAFQNFLFEEMNVGNLSFTDESAYFEEANKIWARVFTNSLKPSLAVSILSQVIQKVNQKLPEGHVYPTPSDKFYEE